MFTLFKKLASEIKEYQSKSIKPISEYERIQFIAENINPAKFIKFNCNENSTIVIRSLHDRITTYNNKLNEVITYLKNDRIIYNAWCIETEKTINTNSFFLNDEGLYVNEDQCIEEFINLSILFLNLYYEHSLSVEVGEHNRRVLSNFKESLTNTIEDFHSIANK